MSSDEGTKSWQVEKACHALVLAVALSACGLLSGDDGQMTQIAEGIPNRDIVFTIEDSADPVLGFINNDGSGYVERLIPEQGGTADVIDGRIVNQWFSWSPDGDSLVGKLGRIHGAQGTPFIISDAGELILCPEDGIYPFGPGRPWISNGTTALTVGFSDSDMTYQIESLKVDTCNSVASVYSPAKDVVLEEFAVSNQGWLAVQRRSPSIQREVLILDANNSEIASIPEARSPAWSRDGQWLAYAIAGEGIFVSSKDGTENRLVLEHSSALHPVWSPDGEWLAYHHVNDSGGPSVISKVNVTKGEIIELFEGGLYPSWRWSSSD